MFTPILSGMNEQSRPPDAPRRLTMHGRNHAPDLFTIRPLTLDHAELDPLNNRLDNTGRNPPAASPPVAPHAPGCRTGRQQRRTPCTRTPARRKHPPTSEAIQKMRLTARQKADLTAHRATPAPHKPANTALRARSRNNNAVITLDKAALKTRH